LAVRTRRWEPVVWADAAARAGGPDACDRDAHVAALAGTLGVPPVVARLLCQRGLDTPEAAARFLSPSVDHLHDPFLLTDLGIAVERLLAAVARKERIAIHGDYDVDGVTSTVILRRTLELLGGDVTHFLPERLRDGYGLQPANVDRLHAAGARVIVSVDCGIRSGAAADRARELGIDLIISDHHEPEATLPRALAVINPKRPDCPYPDKHLAGVGVALKIVHGLCLRSGREKWLPSFLKIAAIGTIADVVPLVGENRVIARLGLERLSQDKHTVGLRALLDGSGLSGKTLDSFHIGFLLAPRINAAGRMASPDIAARLLLASDEGAWDEARALAEQLNVENTKRQDEEASIVAEARKLVETDPDVGAHNVLVVAGEGWHRGVIGIVASKLVDHFHKPAIVLSIDGDEIHGSCRSIPAFDMLGALEGCADLLGRYGGHRQAAGLSLERGRLADFRARVTGLANLRLEPDDLVPRLRLDAPLPLPALIGEVVAGVEAMAPFGLANPRPVFEARDVEVVSGPHVLKDRHLSLHVKQGGRVFRAMAWRSAERAAFITEHRQALALAYSIDRNTWRGESTVELHVADLQAGTSSVPLPAAAVESAT
jgi:single-stranded-DNA-specific exonuclease